MVRLACSILIKNKSLVMKKYFTILLLFLSFVGNAAETYDIKYILIKKGADTGTLIIDTYNSVKEPEYILYPTVVDEGEYSVQLSRVDYNLYQILGTDLYIRTASCYEYGYTINAILIIKNKYDYYTHQQRSYGTLILTDK